MVVLIPKKGVRLDCGIYRDICMSCMRKYNRYNYPDSGSSIQLLFIDSEKAFNSVNWGGVVYLDHPTQKGHSRELLCYVTQK